MQIRHINQIFVYALCEMKIFTKSNGNRMIQPTFINPDSVFRILLLFLDLIRHTILSNESLIVPCCIEERFPVLLVTFHLFDSIASKKGDLIVGFYLFDRGHVR